MRVTDLKTYVVLMGEGRPWTFVEVHTDEGITGLGECSFYRCTPLMVAGIEAVKPLVVGQDPSHIEEIWQRIFRIFTPPNGGAYFSYIMSAIDIALWDIRGKVLGVPVYQLLGGPVRPSVPLYTHIQDQSSVPMYNPSQGQSYEGVKIADAVQMAKATVAGGYQAIKTDPFKYQRARQGEYRGADMVERLSPKAIAEAVDWMDAVREAVGPEYELMVEAHSRFDVASAIAAARAMEHIKPVWYEEPVPPDSFEALRHVRENTRIPLCIGERHYTRWDYIPIFENRLVDYVMPDVTWCGGISELRRIGAMAEPYYVRLSPHDALGPVAIMAAFHVCMTTPNLYRQECVHIWFEDFKKIVTPMFDYHDGAIWPSERPGLGIELDHEAVKRFAVDPWDLKLRRFGF